MSLDKCVEKIFVIKCRGRNFKGKEALRDPIEARITIYQRRGDKENISSLVDCPYNAGGHGQQCKSSHKHVDKITHGIICPYSFDIPYALEGRYNCGRKNPMV